MATIYLKDEVDAIITEAVEKISKLFQATNKAFKAAQEQATFRYNELFGLVSDCANRLNRIDEAEKEKRKLIKLTDKGVVSPYADEHLKR